MAPGKAKPVRKYKQPSAATKRTKSKRKASNRVPDKPSNKPLARGLNQASSKSVARKPRPQVTGLLAAIVDSSDDAIVSKNLDGIITSWNKSAERMFGYSAQEAIGSSITLIIPRDRWDEEKVIIRQIKRGKRVDHFETIRVRKDGSLLNVSVTISPVKDASGRVVGASKVARDISARVVSEQALADRARQQRALFHLADALHRAESTEDILAAGLDAILEALHCGRAAILLSDEAGVMRFVSWRELSEEYRRATDGHSPWQVDERNPSVICMEDVDKAELPEALRAALKKEGIAALAFIPLVPAGKLIGKFMSYFSEPHAFSNEEVELSVTIARQIAFAIARGRSLEALRHSEESLRRLSETLDAEVRARTKELEQRNAQVVQGAESLRELSRRMMQVQDEERRHIARELHDSAGQVLAVLGINVGQLAQKVRQELKPAVEEIQSLVQQLTRELRTMSYLLHPPLLDEVGLSAALNWYVQGLVDRSHIDIRLSLSEDLGRLPPDLELILFRLVQECLTNVHRHSGSKSAAIRLMREGDKVFLEVQDQGQGISPQRLVEIQTHASGVGIQGMRERVRQFHGEMNIESDETGTRISVTVPVKASKTAIPLRAAS
ncbi:MAG TPA: PAS domain S-box protein [Terriglobales bacterium]|nr:PAS domain S-box protein [Terriglobales bacterium]